MTFAKIYGTGFDQILVTLRGNEGPGLTITFDVNQKFQGRDIGLVRVLVLPEDGHDPLESLKALHENTMSRAEMIRRVDNLIALTKQQFDAFTEEKAQKLVQDYRLQIVQQIAAHEVQEEADVIRAQGMVAH